MIAQNMLLKIGRHFLFFGAGAFLFSSIFLCHIPLSQAASLEKSSIKDTQITHSHSNDGHHSSGVCHIKKQGLANQNETLILSANSQTQNPNRRNFISVFYSNTLQNSPVLTNQRASPLVGLEQSGFSQTAQLLTVVKIE